MEIASIVKPFILKDMNIESWIHPSLKNFIFEYIQIFFLLKKQLGLSSKKKKKKKNPNTQAQNKKHSNKLLDEQTAWRLSKLKISNFNFWVLSIKQTLMPNVYRSSDRWLFYFLDTEDLNFNFKAQNIIFLNVNFHIYIYIYEQKKRYTIIFLNTFILNHLWYIYTFILNHLWNLAFFLNHKNHLR